MGGRFRGCALPLCKLHNKPEGIMTVNWLRRASILLLTLLLATSIQAQLRDLVKLNRPRNEERLIRFGIGVSLNVMDFGLRNSGAIHQPAGTPLPKRYVATVNGLHPGFNVNALVRLRFSDRMHLRALPGICFGQRDIEFYLDDGGPEHGTLLTKTPIESSYIEMPILFVYSAKRHSNARPYICAGINPRADMAAFKKLKIENNQFLRLQKFDLAYEIGFGYEFYFPFFKMAPEIKWSGGFLNAISRDVGEGSEHYRDAIKSLTSQVIVLSLIFE